MCQRMKVESPTNPPPSSIYGILPFGAFEKFMRTFSNGSFDIRNKVSALVTNGLASGSPKFGPEPNSLITGLPLMRRPAAAGKQGRSQPGGGEIKLPSEATLSVVLQRSPSSRSLPLA